MYVPEGKGLKARSKKLRENYVAAAAARAAVLANKNAAAQALVAEAAKKES